MCVHICIWLPDNNLLGCNTLNSCSFPKTSIQKPTETYAGSSQDSLSTGSSHNAYFPMELQEFLLLPVSAGKLRTWGKKPVNRPWKRVINLCFKRTCYDEQGVDDNDHGLEREAWGFTFITAPLYLSKPISHSKSHLFKRGINNAHLLKALCSTWETL